MASTYVNNLRLEEMATGEQSGTWGTKTNTNLELIGQAVAWGTRAVANASTDNITIADGAADADRCLGLKLTGGGQACTVTLLPNTSSKTWVMYNATSYTLTFTCGSGANVAILAGETKMIATDGLGSGGVVHDLLTAVNLAGTTKTAALTNAGALTVGGASQFNSTVTVGVNDTGYDVQFFGATSGAHMLWDESADDLKLVGAAGLTVAGNIDVDGTTNLDAVDIDGAVQIDATLSVGVDDTGYDVKFFGDTASAYMLWDTSADDLILGGAARLGVGTAPAADMVLDVNGQIKAGSTGASLDTTPGGFGTFIQTTSSGECAVMAYSSGGNTTLSLHSNTGGAAVVEGLRLSQAGSVVVNEGGVDMDFRVESSGNANMLFVDGGNDRAGIGTASPTGAILHVSGASNQTIRVQNSSNTSRLSFVDSGTTADTTLFGSNAGGFEWYTASTLKMSLKSDGKLGIGTAAPVGLLQIGAPGGGWNGAANGRDLTVHGGSETTTGVGQISVQATDAFGADLGGGISFGGEYSAGDNVDWATLWGRKENGTDDNTAGYMQFNTRVNGGNMTERMRITSTGLVGIGTTTPAAGFDLRTGLAAHSQFVIDASTTAGSGAGGAFLRFHGSNASSAPQIAGIDGSMTNGTDGSESGIIAFFTTVSGTSSEKVRIGAGAAAGTLFIGGTTVRNAGSVNIDYTSASQGGMGINDTASGNGGSHISFLTGGTFRGGITNNNNSAVAYNTTSDARLKENLVAIPDSISRVNNLNPVKFNWIGNGSVSEGFIAQEILAGDDQLATDMVTGDPDGDAETAPMQVDYSKITPLLTAALQQALAKIDDLETRLIALEG